MLNFREQEDVVVKLGSWSPYIQGVHVLEIILSYVTIYDVAAATEHFIGCGYQSSSSEVWSCWYA
jgi:hypothetical protein